MSTATLFAPFWFVLHGSSIHVVRFRWNFTVSNFTRYAAPLWWMGMQKRHMNFFVCGCHQQISVQIFLTQNIAYKIASTFLSCRCQRERECARDAHENDLWQGIKSSFAVFRALIVYFDHVRNLFLVIWIGDCSLHLLMHHEPVCFYGNECFVHCTYFFLTFSLARSSQARHPKHMDRLCSTAATFSNLNYGKFYFNFGSVVVKSFVVSLR